jgi:predicted DNA-binding protein YlxM (UPF0122 family)
VYLPLTKSAIIKILKIINKILKESEEKIHESKPIKILILNNLKEKAKRKTKTINSIKNFDLNEKRLIKRR